MLEIGDKVIFRLSEPDGNIIQGMGNIHHIDSEAIIPIQVELDNAKLLGQKLCRFYPAEVELVQLLQPVECLWPEEAEKTIVQLEPPSEVEKEEGQAPLVEPKPIIDLVIQVVQKIPGYSFNPGDVLAASLTGIGDNTHYYVFDPYTFEQRGCIPKKAFKLLYRDCSPSIISRKAAIMEFVKKSVEKREAAAAIAEQIVKDVDIVEKQKKKVRKGRKKPKTTFEALEAKGQINIFELI
jgi:hypothetical protein